jgi:hypothetical protein
MAVTRDGRTVSPLHRAPWADEPGPIEGTAEAPHLARLSGDFLCAPFAAADVEPAPAHGWPANAPWRAIGARADGQGGFTASFVLVRPVMGARVSKHLTVRDGHPFLYQRHVFEGGAGAIPVAHHVMIALPSGGRLAMSRKGVAETPATPLETDPARGRSALAYPARTTDLTRMPKADGTTADLSRYPIDSDHEDFLVLAEAAGSGFGWSAISRSGENDLVLVLKDPRVLPMTMLWYSNGGRAYAPWNGRHRGVLGVEDGRTASLSGHAASIAPNPWTERGIPTALTLSPTGSVEIRQVIGAVPTDGDFGLVRSVAVEDGHLQVTAEDGRTLDLPYDSAFLAGAG